ncbi:MAG: ECF transporter S component [Adlercreutzia equolifaciens]
MLAPLTVVVGMGIPGNGYYLSGTLIVLFAIVPFFVAFEGRRPTAREIAVVAVLTALAVAARAAFVWVPHFKPMAAIIMIAGIAAGPQTGFLVGSVAALASNFIFGQGPWTPWQMLAFGVVGLVAGLLADARVFPRANLSWPRRIACWRSRGSCLSWGLRAPFWIPPRSSTFPRPLRRSWRQRCTSPVCR